MVGRRREGGEDAKKLSLRLPPAFSPLLQGDECAHIFEQHRVHFENINTDILVVWD